MGVSLDIIFGCSIVFICLTFSVAILFSMIQEKRHAKERKELYDRLMARDLADYRVNTQQEPIKKRPNYVHEAIQAAERERNEKLQAMTDE